MFTQGRVRVVALCIADAVCICSVWTAVVCGYWLLGRWLDAAGISSPIGGYHPVEYIDFWPVAILFVVLNAVLGLYHGSWMYPAVQVSPVEEIRRLFGSSVLTHLGVFAYLVLAYQTTLGWSRVVIVVSGFATALAAQSFRNWMRWFLLKVGIGQIPVVLAGGGEVAARIADILHHNAYVGVRIVGYFEGARRLGRCRRRSHWRDREISERGVPYLGSLRDIVSESKKRDIKILLACQDERMFRLQMDEFSQWFTYIEYLPTADSFPIFGARSVSFDGIGGLEMMNHGRMKMKRLQKRVLDMLLAAVAFVMASPVFLVIAMLIKCTSRGPVFYRHHRLGKNGRPICIWKFRSMYEDAEARLERMLESDPVRRKEWELNFKLANDPRVTVFGRFLRKTSLDELPQLFNVFSGDMALIGPRPIVEKEVVYYGSAYKVFSSVKPGITGLWQVSGRSDTGYTRRVALDTYYVLNWSPWMDLWILERTVLAVLLMRGAR